MVPRSGGASLRTGGCGDGRSEVRVAVPARSGPGPRACGRWTETGRWPVWLTRPPAPCETSATSPARPASSITASAPAKRRSLQSPGPRPGADWGDVAAGVQGTSQVVVVEGEPADVGDGQVEVFVKLTVVAGQLGVALLPTVVSGERIGSWRVDLAELRAESVWITCSPLTPRPGRPIRVVTRCPHDARCAAQPDMKFRGRPHKRGSQDPFEAHR